MIACGYAKLVRRSATKLVSQRSLRRLTSAGEIETRWIFKLCKERFFKYSRLDVCHLDDCRPHSIEGASRCISTCRNNLLAKAALSRRIPRENRSLVHKELRQALA